MSHRFPLNREANKMVAERIQYNATTPKGILRRTRDARFEKVEEPRHSNRIKHSLKGALELGVIGLATDTPSTRGIETRSDRLVPEVDEAIDLEEPISDNAFGLLLRRISSPSLARSLHRAVKAEWTKRERLRPSDGWSKSTIAIDGKHLATLTEAQLRHWVEADTDLEADELSTRQLRELYRSRWPEVQIRDHEANDDTEPDEGLDGLIRVHRATLISSEAATVIDQRSIPGHTNESGEIVATLRSVCRTYGRTNMVQRVTMDAGHATRQAADVMQSNRVDYLMALKETQGELFEMAQRRLGDRGGREAVYSQTEDAKGKTVVYTLWREAIGREACDWAGARQLIRVERMTIDNEGNQTIGNRYFVSSEPPAELTGSSLHRLVRSHWRCENEGHWTCDAIFDEDARRTPWTTHPTGIVNVAVLRVIAINILALLRSMSRLRVGDQLRPPTWRDVIEHAIQVRVESPLVDTGGFDAVDI